MTHSPLPWQVRSESLRDNKGLHIATLCNGYTTTADEDEANAAYIVTAANNHHKLVEALKSALRYIEVNTAYRGAMTADEVEAKILDSQSIAEVSIGANSCNTLAHFDIHSTRALLAELSPS